MKNIVQLIALNNGFLSHAEPLVCDDITGPRSLLGESARIPRPVCPLQVEISAGVMQQDDLQGVVLWQKKPSYESSALEVAATTFFVGACTSTFDVAWELLRKDMLPEWGSVLSPLQKEGRGQLRREWHSPRGNLYVTFRLPKDANLSGDTAALVAGYMLVKSFTMLGFSLSLKWPNDLLCANGKKAGGVLLEERDGILLAGLGVNLVEAPSAAALRKDNSTAATVLFRDNEGPGEDPLTPFTLWQALVSRCIMEYHHSVKGRSLQEVLSAASSLLAWKGRMVTVCENGATVSFGECFGLGPNGGLIIRTANGCVEVFSGSVNLQ